MPLAPPADQYRNVHFRGVTIDSKAAAIERWLRPKREAPTSSIFAKPVAGRQPVVSPIDHPLLDDIFRRGQLNVAAYRPTALARRIPACLRALQAHTQAEALRRLDRDPAALDLALNALLIGVTSFFRDPSVFTHLIDTALPGLLCDAPRPRMLSVGCSDGAELYSLAICLLELDARAFDLRGIDCRRRAIERANAGLFPTAALAQVPPHLRLKYFDHCSNTFRIKPIFHACTQFQLADAFIHIPQPPYDLIACRNFSIYLEHGAAARLWRRIYNSLRPGGLLLTGKAELPTAGFVRTGPCLFRKAPA